VYGAVHWPKALATRFNNNNGYMIVSDNFKMWFHFYYASFIERAKLCVLGRRLCPVDSIFTDLGYVVTENVARVGAAEGW